MACDEAMRETSSNGDGTKGNLGGKQLSKISERQREHKEGEGQTTGYRHIQDDVGRKYYTQDEKVIREMKESRFLIRRAGRPETRSKKEGGNWRNRENTKREFRANKGGGSAST